MGKTSKALGKSGYSLDVQIPFNKTTVTDKLVSPASNSGDDQTEDEIIVDRGLKHFSKSCLS